MALLNIAKIVECTEAEGPSKRFAIWTQGCLKRCEGCCNPRMQEIACRALVECEELFDRIRQAACRLGIKGITLIGGEPFLQAKGLSVVAQKCRQSELSVMTFTGYTLDELKASDIECADELVKFSDILVDGPYINSLRETERNWAGSKNQNIYFLTDFYKPGIEYDRRYSPEIEIRMSDGSINMNGWPLIDEMELTDKL